MTGLGIERRARRALERQLDYQRRKSEAMRGHESQIMADMAAHSAAVREKLDAVAEIPADARVLEVGSGAHGLIFFFEAAERVGVDPLADHYRQLFPAWQGRATTIAAGGERLPLEDASFDIVLCDNVLDHAENPRRIVEEIARVTKPGGLMFFTVNVHHPIYGWASALHSGWGALRIPIEITPFADHTVHLTLDHARNLLRGVAFKIIEQIDTIEETRRGDRLAPRRHLGDRLKRWFFKNARWEVIAVREG
jgi:SAM-dependent methyltransferase